jgi:hypothetical protein
MNSPEETQLADDLRHLVAGQPFAPDVDVIERRGRRLRQRGFAIRTLAGLGVLAVGVAGGLVATNHTSTTGKVADQPAVGTVRVETVAYVRQHIEAALNPAGYLIETRQNTSAIGAPSSMITVWTDPTTGKTMLLRGSGASKVAYWEHDYYKNRVLHWYQTQVNYGPRTWWVYDMHAAGPIQGAVPSGPVGGDYTPAAEVKAMLGKGVKIVGHPVVDGHHTVELSTTGPLKIVVWADSRTYQVVRTEKYFPAALHATPITANYYWVKRSAAMANLINNPQIPAGFTKVAYGAS